MKFKHQYFNQAGCPVLVEGEIGRTENAKGLSFSLTNAQKTQLSILLNKENLPARLYFAEGVLFDGYDYRSYTGMYGYPKTELVAARFIVEGQTVRVDKRGQLQE